MTTLAKSTRVDLTKYEPQKGLKAVAVAEAAERHFRRAKDATKLIQAVELKLTEQRKFVLWWDAQEKQAGARGVGKRVGFQTGNPTLNSLGVDKLTLHRWRIRLKEDAAFAAALKRECDRAVKLCEYALHQGTKSESTEDPEWYTPAEYVEAAREVLGEIDLDPASSRVAQRVVQAGRYFTRETDGLQQEWHGRVFLNPPYTQPAIGHFVAKLVKEYDVLHTTAAILLTHNYTDTAWFHHAASVCSAICFTRGRIGFVDQHGAIAAPTQGQAFFYYGDGVTVFAQRFADIGLILTPWREVRVR